MAHYEAQPWFDTGIFGTDIVTRLLFERGRGDLAVRLLCAYEPHGFGRWFREGSTTLWEYFDYWRAGVTRSYSHPMFGAVVSYFFEHLLGITQRPDSVGFAHVTVRPAWVEELRRVQGYMTVAGGRIEVAYRREGDEVFLRVALPTGVDGTVELPNGESIPLSAGTVLEKTFIM